NGTDAIPTDALHEVAQALEVDFLEGLDLPDCREFQNWCTGEREEARRLRVRVLTALVARLEGRPDEALCHARALSLLEPADEAPQAMLVRLLRTAGRPREAEEQSQSAQRQLEGNAIRTGALRQPGGLPLQAGSGTRANDRITLPAHAERPSLRPARH